MNENLELRFAELIRRKTEGKDRIRLNQLVKDINAANIKAGGGSVVTHRTLKFLIERRPSLGLTLDVIRAFIAYWPELKHLPLCIVPGVFEALVGAPRVVFMLGAKPRLDERRNDISHWDALSLAELLTRCTKQDRQRELDIRLVLWRSKVNPKAITTEDWYREIEADQCSVVSIGSPLASLSSEVMLARMFGVEPFVKPHLKPGPPVPFFFAWRSKFADLFQSAFGLSEKELELFDRDIAAEVTANRASATVIEGEIHKTPATGKTWEMHGFIAAQRRPAGNVWLVVSGLAGPATYAAARKVKDILQEVPLATGKPPKVLWVPVRVPVNSRPGALRGGDIRDIEVPEFDGKVRIWPP